MPHADLLLTGARVLTMDPEQPEAEAVAFAQGRVLAVGEAARIERLVTDRTRVEHLPGTTVLPGFIDAHTHAARLGELHFRADLSGLETKDQAIEIIAQRAERTPAGGWVIAWNWDESAWQPRDPLTPEDLDQISQDHPIMARRVCGHKAVVNTAGLEAIGLDGRGLLTEDDADRAWEACAPSHETCVKGLKAESQRLAGLGITHVADTAGARDVRLLTEGAQDGYMLQRSGLYLREALVEHVEALALGRLPGQGCSLLGVKTYTDGSIGARTAATFEPYEDDPGTGELLRDAKQVAGLAGRCKALGLQLKAHAIGDRAIQAVLDGVRTAGLGPEHRPRVEHMEMVTDEQLEEMAELGMVACMQPNFIANWQGPGGLYEEALGTQRTRAMNPIASVLEAGVPLAFSSDGMPYDPLYGIRAALEHPEPKQRPTVDQALHAYTRGAAYALGLEDDRGHLSPGALADAVVLDGDPHQAARLDDLSVQLTVIGGRVVHEAG